MLDTPFTTRDYLLNQWECEIFTLPHAYVSEQEVEELPNGNMLVTGTISGADSETMKRFAYLVPHIHFAQKGRVLDYHYVQPINGIIDFMESPQEEDTINICIRDYLWSMEISKKYIHISDITKINNIFRQGPTTWNIDINHKTDDDLYQKILGCHYCHSILECNTYVTPSESRTRFVVQNKSTLPLNRIYQTAGATFSRCLTVYPISLLKRVEGDT